MVFKSFKKCFPHIFFLLPALLVYGQAAALQALITKKIFYAPSENNSLKPYLEVYWQIDPQAILFKKENDAWQGKIRTDIVISNGAGKVHEEHYILATQPVTEGALLYEQNIIDLRRYELAAGKYFLEINFSDEFKNESRYTYSDSFTIRQIGEKPALSDIQLVDTFIISDKQDVFQRNGGLQIPLCTNFFGEQRKTLHYYAECYAPETVKDELVCTAFISKKEMEHAVNRLSKTDTFKPSRASIIEGKFPLKTLPSGNYYINILVEDKAKNKIAEKSLFFQLLNKNPEEIQILKTDSSETAAPNNTYVDLNKTFLGKYTPAQIRAILKMLIPIADPTERNNINAFIKRPDDVYSRYFIYNFWLNRNRLNPEESWKEYAGKVKKANKLFGSSLLTGYETDRGIIFLKYGAPTDRLVVNNESAAFPYEIWQYNSLPNASDALFLFYKPGLITNDYKLLHSTVSGEIRNIHWRSSLYLSGAAPELANSRAEQIMGNR